MLKRYRETVSRLRRDEDGAVTVDWVVLTAAMVGLALAAITIIREAATDPAEGLAAFLENYKIE